MTDVDRTRRRYIEPETTLSTYRYLRISLVSAVAALIASVVITRLATGVPQDSVSAYYYTVSHSIFVASLGATGLGLIVYKGEAITEDMLLNFAGFMAFVVALVPTERPACQDPDPQACGLWLPSSADTDVPIPNNIFALLIAVAVGYAFFVVVDAVQGNPRATRPRRARLEVAVRVLGGAVVVFGVVVLIVSPQTFADTAHGYAAIAMFVAMTGVVCHYALWAETGKYTAIYTATAVLMVIGVVWAVVCLFTKGAVFWPEVLLIASFATFWITQTFDLWPQEHKYADEADAMERAQP